MTGQGTVTSEKHRPQKPWDQVRACSGLAEGMPSALKYRSCQTEMACVRGIKPCIHFHDVRHPIETVS